MKKGWQTASLGELCYSAGRIGWKGLTAKEYTKDGPYFLSVHGLNYGDYVDFRDAFHVSQSRYDESPEIMLRPHDVLLCKDGAGIGKVGIINELPGPSTINSSLLLLRAQEKLLPKYLYFALCSPLFQDLVKDRINGATTPHLYQRDIRELKIPLPNIAEQRRIVGILDEALEGIAIAKTNAEKNLANARAVFESHLQSVFSQRGPSWIENSLFELCDIKHGFAFDGADFSSEVPEGKPLVVTPGNSQRMGSCCSTSVTRSASAVRFPSASNSMRATWLWL